MKEVKVYKGTAKKIPFEVRLAREYDWFVQARVNITGLDGVNTLTLHVIVQDTEEWERKVRDVLSVASMTAWQLLGIGHPHAKQLEAVEGAFRLGLYEEEVENEDATV